MLVCTPNDHHIEVMRHCASSGKHILVEKPLATEVAHCAEIEELADATVAQAIAAGRSPPLFWCAMEYRYIPTVAKLVAEAHAGTLGDLKMLSIREHRFPFLRKVGNWNRFSSRTGGTLTEKCCHFFDLMRLILRAEPVRIMASGALLYSDRFATWGSTPSMSSVPRKYCISADRPTSSRSPEGWRRIVSAADARK